MKKKTVVVVEDENDIRDVLKEILHMTGYETITFSNGKEAMDKLGEIHDKHDIGLILLDLMMPVMDGWQFLKMKRSMPEGVAKIPVYILSAVVETRDLGGPEVCGFLRKPVDSKTLIQVVDNYCTKREMEAPAEAGQGKG